MGAGGDHGVPHVDAGANAAIVVELAGLVERETRRANAVGTRAEYVSTFHVGGYQDGGVRRGGERDCPEAIGS